MSQGTLQVANQGFPGVRTDINAALAAINSKNSGTAAPSLLAAGQSWLDVSNGTRTVQKQSDGSDWVAVTEFDVNADVSRPFVGTGVLGRHPFLPESGTAPDIGASGSPHGTAYVTRLRVGAAGAERAIVNDLGYLKASNSGVFQAGTGSSHEMSGNGTSGAVVILSQLGTTGARGIASLGFQNAAPNDTTSTFITGGDTGANRFLIYSNGNIQNANNSYGAISDESLKQDISPVASQLDDVKALAGLVKKFRFKSDVEANEDAPQQIGFVAQEVELVSPGLVYTDGKTGLKGVKHSVAMVKALKAVGEALERIEALEARITDLES
jgi:hypothetical protein